MMKLLKRSRFQIDIELNTRTYLLDPSHLSALQELLMSLAPHWSSLVRILYDEEKKVWLPPIDMSCPGALYEAVERDVTESMRRLKQLEQRFGPSPLARTLGGLQLDGADSSLTVVLHVDEYPLAPIRWYWVWGNRIALNVCARTIEGTPAPLWVRQFVEAAVSRIPIDHGFACTSEEFDAKNISHEGGGTEAVGRDISKALPGLYWLNYFGEIYCELIGRDRLGSAAAPYIHEVGNGMVLSVSQDPTAWESEGYREAECQILDYLGPQFFFSKKDPQRKTIAPAFKFPVQPQDRPSA